MLDVVLWPMTFMERFGPEVRAQAAWWFDLGVYTKSQYSGYGGFELLMGAIEWALINTYGFTVRTGAVGCEATDIAKRCRSVLTQYMGS